MQGSEFLHMDLENFQRMYPSFSRQELERIQATSYDPLGFRVLVDSLHQEREYEKLHGRAHVRAGPLLQVLSIRFLPEELYENKPLIVYGRIYGEFCHLFEEKLVVHDLFNRAYDDPEIVHPNGFMTLTGPTDTSEPRDVGMPLYETKIVVDLWDATQNVAFAQESFLLDDPTECGYEQVKLKTVRGIYGSLSILYVAMPFGVLCRLEVQFYHKSDDEKQGMHRVVNLNGKIVARYDNTCGNYDSEECIVFERQSSDFEQIVISRPKLLKLSRCWITVPAHSSLIIDLDLFNFDTKRCFCKGLVELLPSNFYASSEAFLVDGVIMEVHVEWFSTYPRGLYGEEYDMSIDNEPSSNISIPFPWFLQRHNSKPLPSSLLEVYSVFIGGGKGRAISIFGTIEISCGNHSFHIFNRHQDDPFEVSEYGTKTPIVDGSRVYDDDWQIDINVDLKDVTGNSLIKGYADWSIPQLETHPSWYDKRICSVVRGENGLFATLHYTIFLYAVQANIESKCKLKKEGRIGIYGSLMGQYDNYDYSTPYKREYNRIVLFEHNEQDLVELKVDGKIPLSRLVVVVPSDSSLIVEVDLYIIDLLGGVCHNLSRSVKIDIGVDVVSIETDDFLFEMFAKWSDGNVC